MEFYNCSVVNLVTVGYILVTPCRVVLKGLMAPSCCVHQSDNGGYPAACDVSTLVRIAMTLLIYKKVVSVLNRVDDTRQFFALPTLEVELEVLAELSNQR